MHRVALSFGLVLAGLFALGCSQPERQSEPATAVTAQATPTETATEATAAEPEPALEQTELRIVGMH